MNTLFSELSLLLIRYFKINIDSVFLQTLVWKRNLISQQMIMCYAIQKLVKHILTAIKNDQTNTNNRCCYSGLVTFPLKRKGEIVFIYFSLICQESTGSTYNVLTYEKSSRASNLTTSTLGDGTSSTFVSIKMSSPSIAHSPYLERKKVCFCAEGKGLCKSQ